jgi:cytochrome oxidase Cu insertion factor (SCO1/SenC/PrrC family)
MMQMGISRGLPLAGNCSRAVARGPLLLLSRVGSCACPVAANANTAQMTAQPVVRYNLDRSGDLPMDINSKAPDFTLLDQDEKPVALKDLHGKTVVLFFFPKADTPG